MNFETGTGERRISFRLAFGIFFGLLFLVALLNLNTYDNSWTFDDRGVIVENSDVLSWESFVENSYPGRPLRELSYMLDYHLFGFHPAGYHVQQVFWHALNGFLLFLLAVRIGLRPLYAVFASLLFLVHPIQVESVASVGHRKELLPLAFALLSLLFFDRLFDRSCKRRWLLICGCLLAAILAYLANQTVMSFPLVMVSFVILFRKEHSLKGFHRPKVLPVLALAIVAYGIWYVSRLTTIDENLGIILSQNLTTGSGYWPLFWGTFSVVWYDLIRLLYPTELSVIYAIPLQATPLHWPTIAGILIVVSTIWGVVRLWRHHPVPAFGLLWSVVLHIPVSNVIPLGYLMADRYLYMVVPGLALAVAWLVQWVFSKIHRAVAPLLVAGILIFFAMITWRQNDVWQNHVTLFSRAVEVAPDSADARMMLGSAFLEVRQPGLAKVHLLEAVRLNPYLVSAYKFLGQAEQMLGNTAKAREYFAKYMRYGGGAR